MTKRYKVKNPENCPSCHLPMDVRIIGEHKGWLMIEYTCPKHPQHKKQLSTQEFEAEEYADDFGTFD